MSIRCWVAFALALFTVPAQAQQGSVREGLTMKSAILGRDVRYSVYLPPDYGTSTRQYPVVYLLHGLSDDDTGWFQFGEMDRIVNAGIASGEIPPMIVIMPDGGVSWYVNNARGDVRWEDMFIKELMPHVENAYRIRKSKDFRGIAGLSMGGFGSLTLSMRHPDLFAAVAAFSSAVFTDEELAGMTQERYDRAMGPVLGGGKVGPDRLTPEWHGISVLDIVRNQPVVQLRSVRYYIDCGDDDFLYAGNAMLHIYLRQKEIPHEFRVRDGAHTWPYWRTGLPAGLAFIGQSFRR
jgi:enterochelin esterase-like enzyme